MFSSPKDNSDSENIYHPDFSYNAERCLIVDISPKFSLRKPKTFVSQILRHYLTKEGRVRKLLYCLIRIKESCIRKSERLTRLKIRGILQTELYHLIAFELINPLLYIYCLSFECTIF